MGKMNITAATRRGNDAFHELIDLYKDKRIYNRILLELRFWWQDTKRFINAATPWKDAQGDDLPPIDKEVIVIVDYNAQLNIHGEEQPTYRVEFAHRPNKYTKVWNPDLGEQQVVEVERFGKGEWNTPNVVWWLDAPMPFKEASV